MRKGPVHTFPQCSCLYIVGVPRKETPIAVESPFPGSWRWCQQKTVEGSEQRAAVAAVDVVWILSELLSTEGLSLQGKLIYTSSLCERATEVNVRLSSENVFFCFICFVFFESRFCFFFPERLFFWTQICCFFFLKTVFHVHFLVILGRRGRVHFCILCFSC